MATLSSRIVKAVISAAILGIVATSASAAQYKIKLPVQAQWGNTLLSPGEYLLTTDQGSPEMHISGNGKNMTVLVAATSLVPDGSSNRVHYVDVNGTPVVQQLTLSDTGKTYRFVTPNAASVRNAASRTMAFTLRDKPAAH